MANVFAITTAVQTLKAGVDDGQATTVFTVTNTTSRPLRGIAKIKPLGNTETSWIKIDGETERDFPAGGTHQFTVNFNKSKSLKPPTALQPPESFPFRLDEISAANPDEDFTEGPIVTVEFPERKIEVKKPFPWLIVGIAAAVLLVAGSLVIWLVVRNAETEVPDVTTKTFAEAETELKAKGLAAERVEEIAPDKSLDKVFKQDPAGGAKTAPNSNIKLSFPATTTVPPLKNLTLNDAINSLKSKELKIGSITGDGDAIKNGTLNQVASQNPAANAPAAKGSEVNIGFPCIDNPPLKKCFKISDLTNIGQIAIAPNIRRQIELANPRFKVNQ